MEPNLTEMNSPGVRIREREVQHIWMSPEAPWVREGVASGVPLRATLEGPGADRFSLDVTNAAGSNKAPGGPSEQRQGKAKGLLTLDVATGVAEAHVCVSLASVNHKRQDGSREPTATEAARDVLTLLIELTPECEAHLNRPVLPVRSPPVSVHTSCPDDHGSGPPSPSAISTASEHGLRFLPPVQECNVRRLRFAVRRAPSNGAHQREREKREGRPAPSPVVKPAAVGRGERTWTTMELSLVESSSLGGYFGTIWDCSVALSCFLAGSDSSRVGGKRVVELGAGCGLVSVLCAALGAEEVIATDIADMMPLLKLNVARSSCELGLKNLKAEEYQWGARTTPRSLAGDFDMIVCCDLIYDPAGWPALLESLFVLGGSMTVVYIAHRLRNPQEMSFFEELEGYNRGKGERARVACQRIRLGQEGDDLRPNSRDVAGDYALERVWRRSMFPDVALYEVTFLSPS